ncbi:hypothetical protein O6H91_16G066200 [Diphasiastrum complanatum]|uniref:Uncharacterized protein n=1 Tax=Diphasiastrum complanatum TaxID=34168 RepID=A0ACC2BDB7_DIPCM|nr:hypothetical protein O6H91_16G066200 [Diphasiastrum complanatum]
MDVQFVIIRYDMSRKLILMWRLFWESKRQTRLLLLLSDMARPSETAFANPECPFCHLVRGDSTGRTPAILFRDDLLMAFQDRNPAAYRHYLVVPVDHIRDLNELRRDEQHYVLVKRMLELGESLLQRDAPDAERYRFGFHKPPFNSVSHLHLHCLALPYNSWWRRMKYSSLGLWGGFVSADNLLQKCSTGEAIKWQEYEQSK